MKLVLPALNYKKTFEEAREEMRGESKMIFWEEVGSPKTVEDYIRIRLDHAKGKNLPKDWIPATTYWLIDNEKFIGETTIRHELTEHLRTVGGHIGYWIRPSERSKGYGKEILRLALEEAKTLGIDKALITCDETNIHSRKIIEANDGVYERTQDMGKELPKKLLFWIQL